MIDLMIVFLPTLLQLMQTGFQFVFAMMLLLVASSGKLIPFRLSRKKVFERV
jgi:predicted membrane metal-binding protein